MLLPRHLTQAPSPSPPPRPVHPGLHPGDSSLAVCPRPHPRAPTARRSTRRMSRKWQCSAFPRPRGLWAPPGLGAHGPLQGLAPCTDAQLLPRGCLELPSRHATLSHQPRFGRNPCLLPHPITLPSQHRHVLRRCRGLTASGALATLRRCLVWC